ncbi:uncharacterized protein LOC128242760 [Mya arenaria]|uniref:uncharacterized protein LOC128242760 n=1 Tax=Mya arenaria TaxID=6604 RepID=UPI0022E96F2F|nr:uncharacterized protein LOC128242760 [Mya arenaria]
MAIAKMFVLVFALMTSLPIIICQQLPGLKVIVTKEILDKINDWEIAKLREDLLKTNLNDISDDHGDTTWSISSIRLNSAGSLTSHVALGTGSFTWSATLSDIKVSADWRLKYDPGRWLPTIRDSGSLDLSVGTTSISINVRPKVSSGIQVDLDDCSARVSSLRVRVHGSLLSKFYDMLISAFKGNIENQLEKAICKAVKTSMSKVKGKLTDLRTTGRVHTFHTDFMVDYNVLKVEVRPQHIVTYHGMSVTQGSRSLYVTEEVFSEAGLTSGVGVELNGHVFDNILQLATDLNLLNFAIDYQQVIANKKNKYAYLSCDEGQISICIGKFLTQAQARWPNRVVGLRLFATSAKLEFASGSVALRLAGRVNFTAEDATHVDPMFSAAVNLRVPIQVKFEGGNLSARFSNISGNITFDQSQIGKVLIPGLQNFFDVFSQNMTNLLVEYLNNNTVSFPIKLPRDVQYKTSNVRLFSTGIRVEADLCEKGTSGCSYAARDSWVGDRLGSKITVNDILPDNTTPTTTTTTTTTATTTTTPTTTTTTTPATTTTTTTTTTATTRKLPMTPKPTDEVTQRKHYTQNLGVTPRKQPSTVVTKTALVFPINKSDSNPADSNTGNVVHYEIPSAPSDVVNVNMNDSPDVVANSSTPRAQGQTENKKKTNAAVFAQITLFEVISFMACIFGLRCFMFGDPYKGTLM